MVRRGSTVRVRQRASRKVLQGRTLRSPNGKRLGRAGTRGLLLPFPRSSRNFTEFGLFKGIGPPLTPSLPSRECASSRRQRRKPNEPLGNKVPRGSGAALSRDPVSGRALVLPSIRRR